MPQGNRNEIPKEWVEIMKKQSTVCLDDESSINPQKAPSQLQQDLVYDLKGISADDAYFIRKWQLEWLQYNQFASPKEISAATHQAITSGEIKIGIQR